MIEFSDNQENTSIINNPPTSRKHAWNRQKPSATQDRYLASYNSSNFNQFPLRDLILEQARINDKILEDINVKLDDFFFCYKRSA
jgi:hypothetical protein